MIDGDDAAKRRGRGAGHRDAYLNGRQKTLGVLLKALDETGLGVLGLDQLLDPTAPRVDDGQLGAGEETVQEDEGGDGDEFDPHKIIRFQPVDYASSLSGIVAEALLRFTRFLSKSDKTIKTFENLPVSRMRMFMKSSTGR